MGRHAGTTDDRRVHVALRRIAVRFRPGSALPGHGLVPRHRPVRRPLAGQPAHRPHLRDDRRLRLLRCASGLPHGLRRPAAGQPGPRAHHAESHHVRGRLAHGSRRTAPPARRGGRTRRGAPLREHRWRVSLRARGRFRARADGSVNLPRAGFARDVPGRAFRHLLPAPPRRKRVRRQSPLRGAEGRRSVTGLSGSRTALSTPSLRYDSAVRAPWTIALLSACLLAIPSAQAPLDREAQRWVTQTLAKLTWDQKIGQLIAPAFNSTYLPTDSEEFDELVRAMQESHAGAVIAFGGVEPAPRVLLNPSYGTVILGQPLALAATLNRLQAVAPVPLLASADFEFGAGMRIGGATRFPRAMAMGAAGDEQLAFEAGRLTAIEGRAMGVHVNFAPVADVNNNARNPVINTRSFGEDPAKVGALVAAYVRGLQQGGMLATLKHFPGHGDTEVDSHLGLPIITHPRERL
ncbi:MAG: hypothetical protein IT177_14055, partial [Acidobacteria bacterium]|nr:hypothetical protein [Acidobacteriota bacterium]